MPKRVISKENYDRLIAMVIDEAPINAYYWFAEHDIGISHKYAKRLRSILKKRFSKLQDVAKKLKSSAP